MKHAVHHSAAEVVADSIAPGCQRLTTVLVRFPHAILPQVLTHRVFSRNTSSSRAIPIARLIEDVRRDPFIPHEWRYAADHGMQPGELMSEEDASLSRHLWLRAGELATDGAKELSRLGAAKEHANRILEPFSKVNMVITATEWDNFFALRLHEHAQVEIRHLAQAIKAAMDASTPRELELGEWHLPFVGDDERERYSTGEFRPDGQPMLSAARCARTSYRTHDGKTPSRGADAALAGRLLADQHMSPFEHQAQAWDTSDASGNFSGNWSQHRKLVEGRA